MLIYVCMAAFLLFAFMWMIEALEKRQARDRKKARRRLKSELSNVTWDEATDFDEEPLTLRDWDEP